MNILVPSRLTLLAVLAALALGACSTSKPLLSSPNADVNELYKDAKDDISSGNYDKGIKTLERVEGRGAGTVLAQQAQLDMAYAYWRNGERAQAETTLDRFIKLNPSSPALDYALYLRGIINFNDDLGIMGSLAGQNMSERDQRASRDAYQAFKQLVDQFPNSPYTPDAQARMAYITNSLADYELHVARYYFRRGAFVASANRASQAVIDFQTSPSTEEALYILVLSYDRLGLDKLRDDTRRVFDKNYPNSTLPKTGLRMDSSAWWQVWN